MFGFCVVITLNSNFEKISITNRTDKIAFILLRQFRNYFMNIGLLNEVSYRTKNEFGLAIVGVSKTNSSWKFPNNASSCVVPLRKIEFVCMHELQSCKSIDFEFGAFFLPH